MDATLFALIKTVIVYSIMLLIVFLHGKVKKQLLDCYSFSDDSSIIGSLSAELRAFLTTKSDSKKYLVEVIVVIVALLSVLFFPFSDSIILNGKVYVLSLIDMNYAPVISLLFLVIAIIINVLSFDLVDEYSLKKSNIIVFKTTLLLILTLFLAIVGLYTNLEGSSYIDFVSGQRSIDSYFILRRPINGIVVFMIILFMTSNTDEESKELHLRNLVVSNGNKLMSLTFTKILKISLVLNFVYLFLGGHSILPPLGYLSKIGEVFLCLSQMISLIIKSVVVLFILEWINLRFEKIKDTILLQYSLKYFIPALVLNELIIIGWNTL